MIEKNEEANLRK